MSLTPKYQELLDFVIETAPKFGLTAKIDLEAGDLINTLPLKIDEKCLNKGMNLLGFKTKIEEAFGEHSNVNIISNAPWIEISNDVDFAPLVENLREYQKKNNLPKTNVPNLVNLYYRASLEGIKSRQLTNDLNYTPETSMIHMPNILFVFRDAVDLSIVTEEELLEKELIFTSLFDKLETNDPASLCKYIANKTKFSFNAAVIQQRPNKDIYPPHMQNFELPYNISDVTDTTTFMNGQS